MSRLADAIDRIVFARMYTTRFLDTIPESDWFRMPTEGVTHVAWHVVHLAMAEYRLTLFRFRGERPADEQLISPAIRACLQGATQPVFEPAKYPAVSEIRAVLDRVHAQALIELATVSEADLDSPIELPHPFAKTKLQCLHWCAAHELVHAGQIALLRRLFGQMPIW